LFERGSHRVVAIPNCIVHADPINELVAHVRKAIVATKTPIYSERVHAGLVRYLQLVAQRSSRTVQLVVVGSAPEPAECLPLLDEISHRAGKLIGGLFYNAQPQPTNAILGPSWFQHGGAPAVVETIAGASVFFPPGAFGQANLPLFERIVQRVSQWVAEDEAVVELFAGVGAIGLGLLARGQRVAFNEVAEQSLQGLRLGLEALDPAARARASVHPGLAEQVAPRLALTDSHVLVDPPRKGLEARLVSELCAQRPRRLTYLSCGLESFIRDAEALCQGGLRCERVEAYALFPFTEHVETLAHFVRGS
jgi:tRNA/tmRNA/rRNA uracil-C5-methylase (TrmA/RlmC/RlmD family)